jgi:lipid-binding SYLF domain-containing protein
MAYASTGLILLVPGVGAGPAVWYYKSNDAHTDVDGAGYFSNADDRGMKDNDIVIVVDEDTATTTIHHVSGVTAGAATIAAATLA